MSKVKLVPFIHRSKVYDIHIVYDIDKVEVQAFLNESPVNDNKYSVNIAADVDVKQPLAEDPVQRLIDAAINDIKKES